MSDEKEKLPFWQKGWLMWLCLVFVPPIGMILCYVNREKYPKWKYICGIGLVWFIICLALSPSKQQPQQMAQTQQAEQKQVESKKEEPKKEEAKNILPICPRAGIGDTVDNFKRAVPGKNTSDMTYEGKGGVSAIFTSGKVYQVEVMLQATTNGRHSDLSVKDYYPNDAVLIEDKGADNDQAGSWRWWSVYHSDKLAESMPSSNGNFVIIQRLYDSGKVNFIISIGDHL